MAIKYPNQIDDTSSIPVVSDNVSRITADVINRLRSAILAIESELGVKPSGIAGTIKNRLGDIEAIISTLTDGYLSQILENDTLYWEKDNSAPTITQTTTAANNAIAANMTIAAQSASGTESTGGNLNLTAGTGTLTYGQVKTNGALNIGGLTVVMSDINQTVSLVNSNANIITTTGSNSAVRTLTISVTPNDGLFKIIRNNCTTNGIRIKWLTGDSTDIIPPQTSAIISSDGIDCLIIM